MEAFKPQHDDREFERSKFLLQSLGLSVRLSHLCHTFALPLEIRSEFEAWTVDGQYNYAVDRKVCWSRYSGI